jgi:hypothetical protein
MNLFEMTAQQRRMLEEIESGELSEELAKDTLEGADGEIKDKLSDYCHVNRNLTYQLTAIDAELDRLTALRAKKKNEIWVMIGLDNMGKKKLDTGLFKLSVRSGSKSVQIVDSEKLSDEFIQTKVTFSPDKRSIKERLKAGEDVAGAVMVTGERSLSIK